MKIIAEQLERGFLLHFDDLPFPSRKDAENWSQIVGEILRLAYLNRSGWLIAVEPQSYSLIKDLTGEQPLIEEEISGKSYIFQYQTLFTTQILSEIAAEDDFSRALLWFVSAAENEKSKIYEIIRAMEKSERLKNSIPAVENEWLFAGFDYAEMIYWFNPSVPEDQIFQNLSRIADSYGYELSLIS